MSSPSTSSAAPPRSSYGRGARVLSIGIATTGLVTFAYFALAAHALTAVEYKRISLVWSIMFVVASVIYRPIEQLLSRTIADRRARGLTGGHNLRVPLLIQAAFALTFLVVALALRDLLQNDLFDGSAALYWVLVVGVLAYAASYFARGFLAGHQRFELYGLLVFLEAISRVCFALAVVVGIASGQSAVAIGMAVAPLMSLLVVPWFFARRQADPPADPDAVQETEGGLTLRLGLGFAVAVFAIMVAEQTLLNAAVLTVEGTSDDAVLAGIVFSVLLIARAPLQLFQAVQGSLLPHLAGLQATAGADEFRRAIRITVLAIAGFALAVAARPVRDRPAGGADAVRHRPRHRARRPGARRAGDGLSPRRRHAQPGRAGPRPGARRGARVAGERRGLRGLDAQPRRSRTSCCAPRSATAARPRRSAPCWRRSTVRASGRRASRACPRRRPAARPAGGRPRRRGGRSRSRSSCSA